MSMSFGLQNGSTSSSIAEGNESPDKQTDRAAASPVKKPETETAHLELQDAAKAASGPGSRTRPDSAGSFSKADAAATPGPLGATSHRPRGLDVSE